MSCGIWSSLHASWFLVFRIHLIVVVVKLSSRYISSENVDKLCVCCFATTYGSSFGPDVSSASAWSRWRPFETSKEKETIDCILPLWSWTRLYTFTSNQHDVSVRPTEQSSLRMSINQNCFFSFCMFPLTFYIRTRTTRNHKSPYLLYRSYDNAEQTFNDEQIKGGSSWFGI